MVTLKQFNGSVVTPTDDANLYHLLYGRSGIVTGIEATHAGTNQVSISAGWGIIYGRVFTVEAQSLGVTLSGGANGRLKIVIDLSNITTPAYFESEAAVSLPPLTQENLSESGNVFEVPICTYNVGAIAISNLVDARAIVTTTSAANILLTGYTKPASSTALAAADTVNAALGKLEAGDAYLLQWGKAAVNDDLDDCLTVGIYYFVGTTANTPIAGEFGSVEVAAGTGIVYDAGVGDWIFHRARLVDFPNIFFTRLAANGGAFTPWKQWGSRYIAVSSRRDFALTDANNTLLFDTTENPLILTVRNDSVVNFPIGTIIRGRKTNTTGYLQIYVESGVLIQGLSGSYAQSFGIEKIAANQWTAYSH